MSDLVDRYLACWNCGDDAERGHLVARLFADDVRYVDPTVDARGVDELLATMAAVRDQFPQFVFTSVGDSEVHHDVRRFRWGLGMAGAPPLIIGADVVQKDAEGLITAVVAFLDVVPA